MWTSIQAELVGDHRGRLVGATVAAPAGGEVLAAVAAHATACRKIDEASRQRPHLHTVAEGPH